MHLTHRTTAKRHGFRAKSLTRRAQPRMPGIKYLRQRSSFIMAAFSLFAFIAGNMMGQHGWHAFWASVFGNIDDSVIVFTGVVPPIARVPNYTCWARYGGDVRNHTFRQVPQDCLTKLPTYIVKEQRQSYEHAPAGDVYSVGHMGSYTTGAEGEGSHVGVDIRVPEGTPILAIASGIVESVREDANGFGKIVVIRHPHFPDPSRTGKVTVLHSVYAHLSAQLVAEGDIVQKGQEIALSGKTGFATGPHLHFQVDRDEAPWHPYWAFTTQDMHEAKIGFTEAINKGLKQERGYELTVHPMLLVQSNLRPVIVQKEATPEQPQERRNRILAQRDSRLQRRAAKLGTTVAVAPSSTSSSPLVLGTTTVATAEPVAVPSAKATPVAPIASVEFRMDQSFSGREWKTAHVTLLDASGNPVSGSSLDRDIHLRTAYGEAEFRPAVLTRSSFDDEGTAEFQFLPLGRRTVVIRLEPYGFLSKAVAYKSE